MQKDVARAGEALSSIPRHFDASKNVGRGEFLVFTGGILDTHPEFQALEWLPRVPDSQRASFESGLGRIAPSPVITQLNEQMELVRADQRTEYFPVLFAEPFEPNKGVLGFDAASRSEALDVMHLARDSGRIASTGSIRFIQSAGHQQGILLYAPVYRQGQASDGIAAKRTNLAGYVVGALRYDVLLENALKGSVPTGLDWLLIDPNTPPANSLLYYHPSRTRGQHSTSTPDPADVRAGLHFETTIELPGRKWQLLFRPAPAFDAEFASYWHWIILLAGLTLTGLLAKHIAVRIQAEANLRISATAFETHESLMITDANSVIIRVNQAFIDETGYMSEEAIGQTPRLFSSGRHDETFYKAMWETISSTGKWQGEVWDRRKNGEIYPKWLTISAVTGVDGVVTHYVGSHIDITERKAAENKIQHLAFYDPLTQLPNRRLFTDRLQQALASSSRRNRQGALLFLDLDNFKTLNDTLGHDIGDLLLQQVAQRLQSCVREGDTVARLGGDEFVVLLEDLSEQISEAAEQTEAIGEKILAALNLPYQLAAHKYHSTPSIGATLFNGHQQSMDELLKQADIAMYQSKQAGRNALRFFNPKMQETINSRAALEGELRNALEKQQFHLYYQIQVDILGRPLGAEVLIRWIHPERGMVSPFHFIPLVEETGLILPIGLWVLDTACARIKAWEQNAHTRDLVLAVNVSAKQFSQADFVAQVQGVVQRHGINPARLKLELTESMLVENVKEIIATMTTLKEMGIQFSLDDFGTGYSSLQYLQKLPLDQLKIDQSFVRNLSPDPNGNAIVRTIIAMAKGLNVDIIAEGVETEVEQQLLHYLGCDHYQGYLFSKPVPVEQFEALLK